MTMTYKSTIKSGVAAAILIAAYASPGFAAPAQKSEQTAKPNMKPIVMSIGRSQQINLPSPITDIIISDPSVADVEVKSPRRMYIFAKGQGETTIYATDAAGRTVYQALLRVGNNLDSIDDMLLLAMPESDIKVATMNGVILLTGTVDQPEEAAEAERLVTAFAGTGTQVISRIKTATPLQINLHVRIAEVSRSLSKEISTNLQSSKTGLDSGGNPYLVGAARGRDFITDAGKILYPEGGNTITALGRLFGIDVAAAFDLSERAGLVSTLANPNLTTVSGETASFLAGGSFPIVTSSNNGTSVEYKTYGVNLTYTPIVMADGRISLRVRSEVSDISSQGAVRIGGFEIPATTSRMAETTVELGSGQSMMIAGLLSNQLGSSAEKIPGVGDVPILGALFKSTGWRRNETELMIVVTPYLVKPVSDSQIVLPTDGIHTPTDLERVLLGTVTTNKGKSERPMPRVAPDAPNGPEMSSVSQSAPALAKKSGPSGNAATPGFSFND
jgi:pilus assembly protein CpaC